jgi:hypothetical protein
MSYWNDDWSVVRVRHSSYDELCLNNRLLRSVFLILITKFLLDIPEVADAELLHFFHSLLQLFFRLPSWKGFPAPVADKNGNERSALREVI